MWQNLSVLSFKFLVFSRRKIAERFSAGAQHRLQTTNYRLQTSLGFSILEVLITTAIIGIITAIVVIKYGSFNNVVLLKNQAYKVAADLREAQNYAVSVRGEAGQFREDYGLYFNVAALQQYILFLDQGELMEGGQAMAYYDNGEQLGTPYLVDSRFQLKRICVNIVSESNNCPTEVDDLSVTFKRPDPDAQFASEDGRDSGVGFIGNARIEITGVSGGATDVRAVVVNSTGQISVE